MNRISRRHQTTQNKQRRQIRESGQALSKQGRESQKYVTTSCGRKVWEATEQGTKSDHTFLTSTSNKKSCFLFSHLKCFLTHIFITF